MSVTVHDGLLVSFRYVLCGWHTAGGEFHHPWKFKISPEISQGEKFGQLILMRIIEIVATRCQILRLKCTKFDFG